MSQQLTIQEIKKILLGTESTLRMIQQSEAYQKIQNSEQFHTSNDLTLGDALQAVSEVYEALISAEYAEHIF